jgi:hypothetical protein
MLAPLKEGNGEAYIRTEGGLAQIEDSALAGGSDEEPQKKTKKRKKTRDGEPQNKTKKRRKDALARSTRRSKMVLLPADRVPIGADATVVDKGKVSLKKNRDSNAPSMWKCPLCTFQNPWKKKTCKVCREGRRASSQAGSEDNNSTSSGEQAPTNSLDS